MLIHLNREYARHLGHGGILREQLAGVRAEMVTMLQRWLREQGVPCAGDRAVTLAHVTMGLAMGLLAERTNTDVGEIEFPPLGPNQGWMWQTILNGLTFHPNFARDVRAGRLRPAGSRGRFAFAIDCVVSVLAAPFVLVLSFSVSVPDLPTGTKSTGFGAAGF